MRTSAVDPYCSACALQVAALLADRLEMVADADSRVDWAMAEALAFGTLLLHRCVGRHTPGLSRGT
jgi:2-oxoglutarate dehydrogenase complex dehydrogenase (E1) component-like enzyme